MFSFSAVSQNPALGMLIMIGGGIGGFILAIAILMIRPNNPQILMGKHVRNSGRIVHWCFLIYD